MQVPKQLEVKVLAKSRDINKLYDLALDYAKRNLQNENLRVVCECDELQGRVQDREIIATATSANLLIINKLNPFEYAKD